MSSSKCAFTCICGIFLPLHPSTTTVYAWSAFYPSLRFALSLQSAFYTQSAFYPWSAVCSPQSAFYTDRIQKQPVCSNIKYQVYVRNSEILYLPYKLIGALDHDKPFRLCFFWREEINIPMWGSCFCF